MGWLLLLLSVVMLFYVFSYDSGFVHCIKVMRDRVVDISGELFVEIVVFILGLELFFRTFVLYLYLKELVYVDFLVIYFIGLFLFCKVFLFFF